MEGDIYETSSQVHDHCIVKLLCCVCLCSSASLLQEIIVVLNFVETQQFCGLFLGID
jgi:hypothetical protein